MDPMFMWLASVGVGMAGGIYHYVRNHPRKNRNEEDEEENEPVRRGGNGGDSFYAKPRVTREAPAAKDGPRELLEAVHYGERALGSLRMARSMMDRVRGWGMTDLGGERVAGMLRQSSRDSAERCIEQARADLKRFGKELRDVPADLLETDTGSMQIFCDRFFDGFLSNLSAQDRVREARRDLDDAITRVRDTVDGLRRKM